MRSQNHARFVLVTVLVISIPACGPAASTPGAIPLIEISPTQTQSSPSVIFYNGTLLTMDKDNPTAEALALMDDIILAVGTDDEILALKDSSTQVIDLQGRTVLPGFIDSHQHRIGDRALGGYEQPEPIIQLAVEQGWTSINELYVTEQRLNELRSLDQAGKLRLRINAYLPLHSPEGDPFGDWYHAYQAGHEYSPYLRLAGVKIYMDHGWGRGTLLWTQEELDAMVLEAHRLNWQIAVHTVGERAHTMILNALEKAQGGAADARYRHRIEHIVVISDNDIQRMKRLGIIGSIQLNGPGGWVEWPDWEAEVTPDMYPHVARYRDLIDAGVFMVGSGDWPWGWPPIEPGYDYPGHTELLAEKPGYGSPMLLLYQAVTRTGTNRRAPESWMLDQALTMEQALSLLTINGAFATFEEDKKGSLESGKLADIVILSESPLTAPIEKVADIQILMTMIGGKVEHCGVGQESLCPRKQTAASVPQINSEPPTLIFYNGTVLTIDQEQPTAEAIAVADDKVVAVGSNDDILALQIPDTQLVDLQGRTLMPGFVDTHTHIFNEAVNNPEIGNIENAQQVVLQNGITTIGNLYTTREFLAEMRAMEGSGQLRVRTSMYLSYTTNCGDVLGDWYKEFPPTRNPGEMLRIAGVKVFTDGGSCKFPAVSFKHPEWGEGNLFFTQDRMNTIVSDIDSGGYQIAIHAIGDRAVEQALSAIEFALEGKPNTLRHRIEHNTIVRPDLFPRYQEIGIVASIIGNIWSCNMNLDPPENEAWYFPYRGLLDASPEAHFAWHADYPWASQNPLFHLYSLVTPYEIAGDRTECEDPSGITKTITVDEALPIMTIGGAYAMFREKEVGSLIPGKYADLIILSGNPTTNINAVKDIEVWMTMVGGHVEWCAPSHEELCPGTLVTEGSPISAPFRIRIQITTTSDWATLTLKSGGNLIDPQVISASAEATNSGAGDNRFSINQTIERANSGASVEIVVDAYLSEALTSGQLEFVIESGAIGDTTVKVFNYLQDPPVEASSTVLNDMSKTFNVSVKDLISP